MNWIWRRKLHSIFRILHIFILWLPNIELGALKVCGNHIFLLWAIFSPSSHFLLWSTNAILKMHTSSYFLPISPCFKDTSSTHMQTNQFFIPALVKYWDFSIKIYHTVSISDILMLLSGRPMPLFFENEKKSSIFQLEFQRCLPYCTHR